MPFINVQYCLSTSLAGHGALKWTCTASIAHSQWWIVPILSGIVAIAVTVFMALLFKKKYQRRIVELEQRFLLIQMNPHFVFNSLTAIQNYIFRNDPYQAAKYLSNFSKLVRLVLENSRKDLIPISNEVETLSRYLELQQLRFEDKFEYAIFVDPDIDPEHHTIPPMLTQPFIENAIEHGIIHLSDKGFVKIRFNLLATHILLEVEDNGVGYEKSCNANQKKLKQVHESLAIKITNERLQNLGKVYRRKFKMEIRDLSRVSTTGEHGTLIRFILPFNNKYCIQ